MPQGAFPHLRLASKGTFRAKFVANRATAPEVKANRANRIAHAAKIRSALQKVSKSFRQEVEYRLRQNLPAVPAGTSFIMRIPDGADPDYFANALGVELVAESERGFILVASSDLSFKRLEEVLAKFAVHAEGGGAAASILDVFESPDSKERIEQLFTEEVLSRWPFNEEQEYIFDISIQTAEGTRSFSIPPVRKRKNENVTDFERRKEKVRLDARIEADTKWNDEAEARYATLSNLVTFYNGEFLTGVVAADSKDFGSTIRFPDSFQVRARISGRGWTDIIKNLPNIFELSLPENIVQPLPPDGVGETEGYPEIEVPRAEAPAVCIVDSGIQEAHLWLQNALDSETSRSFLPNQDPNNVSDEVSSGGHGTRVAGAVLYPREVPKNGAVTPIAWLQNARVLDSTNQVPNNLPAAKYVELVVNYFQSTPKQTRIYNHSISANGPCTLRRMSTWATKIDELSHRKDILFIQSAGNIDGSTGQPTNPGIWEHLQAGRNYPNYLEEPAARISNPAQSLQALTVGSVAADTWVGSNKKSFATRRYGPSAFSRAGYGIWDTVKPEVVEIGGDYIITNDAGSPPVIEPEVAVELVRKAGDGGPAVSKDAVGTSYSTPKVTHLVAILQQLFPNSPSLLYRGLIVHGARWPEWMVSDGWNADRILKLIGFGLPSIERSTQNAPHRLTFITPESNVIRNQGLHLYRIVIPQELRETGDDIRLRMDVTLSYSSEPRRTRASRRGYLATWLDWRSSGLGEPFDSFKRRMISGETTQKRRYTQPSWCLHYAAQRGDALDTQRGNGTIQKDWAYLQAHQLPEEMFIAVRAHKGWDHREGTGGAQYCLMVSFEAQDISIPVYEAFSAVNIEVETTVEQQIAAQ